MIPYTQRQLIDDLHRLGVSAGQTLMMHASVKAVGSVMGGPNVILQAVLDVLTPQGTLMMYAGWQDIPDYVDELPAEEQQIYFAEHPAFDPLTSRAVRENSILAEFLRTWPQAHRSLNPEASMVAVGARAAWITQDHPINYGYGTGSPLAKLVETGGKVLMLGAPLDTVTLLHYAEYLARMRQKEVMHYFCPVMQEGQKVWLEIEEYETGYPHDDYSFEQISNAYIAARGAQQGKVGGADCTLFDAADLVDFAVHWLEAHFGA